MAPDDPFGDKDREPDIVLAPNGNCAHIELNEALLCDLHDTIEYHSFDPDGDDWPENGVCSNCRWIGQVIGIVHSSR